MGSFRIPEHVQWEPRRSNKLKPRKGILLLGLLTVAFLTAAGSATVLLWPGVGNGYSPEKRDLLTRAIAQMDPLKAHRTYRRQRMGAVDCTPHPARVGVRMEILRRKFQELATAQVSQRAQQPA